MAIDKGLFQAPKKPTRSKLNVPAPQDAEALRVPLAEKPPKKADLSRSLS